MANNRYDLTNQTENIDVRTMILRIRARGYKDDTVTNNGFMLARIVDNKFIERALVTRDGRARQFKIEPAIEMDIQRFR